MATVAPGLAETFPPLRSLESCWSNLPRQLTPLIGRDEVLAEIEPLIHKHALVTLVGTGGVGKTRVALQAGADSLDVSGDGVWLVELASASDAGLVASTIASTLGLREQPDRSVLGTLLHYLKDKRLLLILDNCEHVIDEVARIADAIMRACHDVRLLATSREHLRIEASPLSLAVASVSAAKRYARGRRRVRLRRHRALCAACRGLGCEVWADQRERADRCGDLPTPRRHRAGD